MKKIISLVLVIILLMGITVGCTPKEKNQGPINLVDPLGNEVLIPENIETIISLGPSITQVLLELGLGDKIIAIDTYSTEIEGVKSHLPSIDMMAPDIEQLIALNPDIVLAAGMMMVEGEDPLVQVKDADIAVAYIPTSNSLEEIYGDLEFISKAIRLEDQGKDLIDSMKKEIDDMKEIGDTITDKKTVYFEIGAAPYIYSFGSGVYLSEILEILGAENIFSELEGWMSLSEEDIIIKDPDIIITNVNYMEDAVGEIKARDGWQNMKAIKNNQVFYVDNDNSSQPNHNIIKAMKEIAKVIYPDKF